MKPATIADYNAARSEPDRRICELLQQEIDRGLPDAEARIWHAHPVWFLADNPIVGYGQLKSCIRLMFWSGQSFSAPGLAPTGTFKAAEKRYTTAEEVDPTALALWLAEAREVQWDYKNIVKRKGRLERLG
ncbi:DUF1801 domain-containing protein [Marinovum sp.]|uniref:DUF1801 domain-containing protein n=1 Tax=Marinovum sp. TaxID=2024839 RepID=UPI003A92036B